MRTRRQTGESVSSYETRRRRTLDSERRTGDWDWGRGAGEERSRMMKLRVYSC